MQGGSIGLESKLGTGTRFFFKIPYSAAAKTGQPVIRSSENGLAPVEVLKNARILLVEDNEFNKIVAEDTIMEHLPDVSIDHAGNGLEALEKLESNSYSLVLMDIQMPEMDGYEATKRIRLFNDGRKDTPVMAMTANATPEEISKCFESGVDEYISKPFNPEELFRKMSQLVLKKRDTVK